MGGYLPFEFPVTPHLDADGANYLVIRVDNAPRLEWLPGGKEIEWVPYGGILQPVLLASTARVYISDLKIVAMPARAGAQVTCDIEVTNHADAELRGEVTANIPLTDSTMIGKVEVLCHHHNKTSVTVTLNIPSAEKWSPTSPVLHQTLVKLTQNQTVIDEIRDTFGVRTIEVRDRELLLNGEALYIKGINRWEFPGPGLLAANHLACRKWSASLA